MAAAAGCTRYPGAAAPPAPKRLCCRHTAGWWANRGGQKGGASGAGGGGGGGAGREGRALMRLSMLNDAELDLGAGGEEDATAAAATAGDNDGELCCREASPFSNASLSSFGNLNLFLLLRKLPFSNMSTALGCSIQ